MKLTILIDDISNTEKLKSEHGFSLFIEDNIRILFDSGASSKILHNSEKLNISLESADYFLISHNHHDHTGGIDAVKNILKNKLKLLVGRNFFDRKYKMKNSDYKIISSDFINQKFISDYFDIISVDSCYRITDNFFVISLAGGDSVLKNYFFIKNARAEFIPDNFNDEIILVYKNDHKLTILSGCSHTGVAHIINRTEFYFPEDRIINLIGGLHLEQVSDEYFHQIAEKLRLMEIQLFAGHCTGNTRLKQLSALLGNRFNLLEAGKEIII